METGMGNTIEVAHDDSWIDKVIPRYRLEFLWFLLDGSARFLYMEFKIFIRYFSQIYYAIICECLVDSIIMGLYYWINCVML